jgi:hypothetical protein
MPTLRISPMWKNNGRIEHIDENVVSFTVEPLPQGVGAYIVREGEHQWRYETVVDKFESVESESQFNSPSDAATALAEWLTSRAATAPSH